MIGQTIWTEFFGNKDWPAASAVAVLLVGLLVTPIVIYQNQATRAVERE
jgi:putrescine transport system permease protein